jgi:integrase/recombinase XerD
MRRITTLSPPSSLSSPATQTAGTPQAAPVALRLNLRGAIDLFLDACKAKGLSPGTVSGFYAKRLGFFVRWVDAACPQAMEPGNLTPTLLRDFLNYERQRTSPATAKHAHRSLSVLCKFMAREGIIPGDPMQHVEPPKAPVKLVEPLTEDEVARMLGACGGGFVGARLRAMLLVFVDCGLRVSELCALRLEDVDFAERTMRVMGKGAKERLVPFGQATRQALTEYMVYRGELPTPTLFVGVYGQPMQARQVHNLLGKCGQRAGVSGVYPHRLRHTAALLFLRGGGDAFSLQKLLGHTDLTMTRRYCALADADLQAKHRLASPGDRFLAHVKPTSGRRRLR